MIPYYILSTIHIGPLTFHTWGLFAGLAFTVALFIALKEARRVNIGENNIFDLAILVLAGGVIGARVAYVLENWNYFRQNRAEIFSFQEGGLMFFGGALVALFLVGVYAKWKKLNIRSIIDALVPSFAIGEFIGRIGCALSDLHLGAKTALPWAQEYLDGSARHPIAIYMSLNGLAMFIVFWFLRKKVKIKGALFLFFILWYSGIRFFLDFLRCSDLEMCDPRYSGYTPSQYISAIVFIFSLIYLIFLIIIRQFTLTRLLRGESTDKKHMAEQQKDSNVNKNGAANENKDLPNSAISYAESQKVVLENKASNVLAAGILENSTIWKDKLRALVKKPWIKGVALIVALAAGAIGAAVYYNSVYYGKMFAVSPFSFQGKTWVSFEEPIVSLNLINDKACEKCDVSEVVKQLKGGVLPTLSVKDVDFNSEEGKKLIEIFSIKSVPALIFDSSIEKTAIFENAKNSLINKNNFYYLGSAASGIPPGKFLEIPKISAGDRVKGSESAPVTIIEFSDFQCPYCKQENDVVKQILIAYPDKVRLIFKHLPLPSHAQAQASAEAAECAGDQGKFWEMADMLFAKQDKLDAVSIAGYARTSKLDAKKFKECVDGGKFKNKVENDAKIASEFGIAGTPAFFVGDEFIGSALPFEEFKKIIDAQLAK